MRYFPVYLNLKDARCLVVGGGRVGCRKIRDLLASDIGSVVVFETGEPTPSLVQLTDDSRVTLVDKRFEPSDVYGMRLVFAATDNPVINESIVKACREADILCDSASSPKDNGFILPARVESGVISLAVSTSGASPVLARRLKMELASIIENYGKLAELLRRLRPSVLAHTSDSDAHARIFAELVDSDLAVLLNGQDGAACVNRLRNILPEAMHHEIEEVLRGLV